MGITAKIAKGSVPFGFSSQLGVRDQVFPIEQQLLAIDTVLLQVEPLTKRSWL